MSAHPEPNRQTESATEVVELSICLPADMIAALKVASFQRRSLGEEDVALPSLVCEAISQWLEREIDNTTVVVIRS